MRYKMGYIFYADVFFLRICLLYLGTGYLLRIAYHKCSPRQMLYNLLEALVLGIVDTAILCWVGYSAFVIASVVMTSVVAYGLTRSLGGVLGYLACMILLDGIFGCLEEQQIPLYWATPIVLLAGGIMICRFVNTIHHFDTLRPVRVYHHGMIRRGEGLWDTGNTLMTEKGQPIQVVSGKMAQVLPLEGKTGYKIWVNTVNGKQEKEVYTVDEMCFFVGTRWHRIKPAYVIVDESTQARTGWDVILNGRSLEYAKRLSGKWSDRDLELCEPFGKKGMVSSDTGKGWSMRIHRWFRGASSATRKTRGRKVPRGVTILQQSDGKR